ACIECGRCDENCPALLTDKPLSPKRVILDLKEHLFATGHMHLTGHEAGEKVHGEGQPLVGGVIQDETLWSCTTCRWCVTACPVFIEHVPAIMDMKRWLVMEANRFPPELQNVFESMERNQNPLQVSNFNRADWAAKLGVKTMAEDPNVDVLYW